MGECYKLFSKNELLDKLFEYFWNILKVSCGFGILIRNRTCLPAGSVNCIGDSVEVETCDSGVTCSSMYLN